MGKILDKIPSREGMPLLAGGGFLTPNLAEDFLKAPYQVIKPDGEDIAKVTAKGDDVIKQGAKEVKKPDIIDSQKIIKEKSGKETGSGVQITDSVNKTEVKDIVEKTEVKDVKKEINGGELSWTTDIVEIKLPKSKYPESAQHIEDAIKNGQPDVLTIKRGEANANRRASLKGLDKVPGKDLDEYPPEMFQEVGQGSSVRPINPSDNRGAGSTIGHRLRPYLDGTKVKITIEE